MFRGRGTIYVMGGAGAYGRVHTYAGIQSLQEQYSQIFVMIN